MKLEFCRQILRKKALISSFIKISPVGAELFHADGRTDMKLIVAFRNYANAPKKKTTDDIRGGQTIETFSHSLPNFWIHFGVKTVLFSF
jgi:hypothetical protein